MNYPQQAWSVARQIFVPKDLNVEWQTISFKADRETWLKWKVDWRFRQLKFQRPQPELSVPIDDLELNFSFSLVPSELYFKFQDIRLITVEPIHLTFSDESQASNQNFYLQFQHWLSRYRFLNRYLSVEKLDLSVKEAKVGHSKESSIWLSLTAKNSGEEKDPQTILSAIRVQTEQLSGTVNSLLSLQNLAGSDQPFLKSTLQFEKDGAVLSGDLATSLAGEQIYSTYKGSVSVKWKEQEVKFDPDVVAAIGNQGADIRITSSIKNLPDSLPNLEKWSAQISFPLVADQMWSDNPATFKIAGSLPLFFVNAKMRAPLEDSCKCQLPQAINVAAKGNFWIKHLLGEAKYKMPLADVSLQVESFRNKLFDLDIGFSSKVFHKGEEFTFEPEVDSVLRVSSFQGLRKFLDSQNIMIPAPFDVLEGTVDVTAKGPLTLDKKGNRAKLLMNTNLHSENQKVNLGSEVILSLDPELKGAEILVSLLIQDVQIELPPFDLISGMPALRADERVQLAPKKPPVEKKTKPDDAFKVKLMWAAETKSPGAIKLLTKYAKPNIPLTVDVKRGISGDIAGFLKTETFEAQYFRRSMTVEQLRVLTYERDVDADFPVDGRLRIDQTQYTIYLDISGTLRSPFIKLSSEPELPRADIISVLLFDRKRDQLSPLDVESAGNFEAAISDRAIGLLGLWAFATTPIRSFSYNSATKVYTATVQLAESVTASIGTSWEEAAHLEVRKRISKHWVLTASWATSERDPQSGRLVLQWEKRF